MTSQRKTGTLTEKGRGHLATIKAAIEAAKEDGFLLEFWSHSFESQHVQLLLRQNLRGEDGVMRRVFEEEITDGFT